MTIGETLLLARRRANLSQAALARDMGISAAFVSMIENQKKRFPVDRLERLPREIRGAVIDALVAQKEAEIVQLRAGSGHDGGGHVAVEK